MLAHQEMRQSALQNARSIVVKVGSAVLTKPSGLDMEVLNNLVEQLAYLSKKGCRVTLVSSGAVAAGRTILAPFSAKIEGLAGLQGAAAIGQCRLMREYEDSFFNHDIICAQVLLTRDDLRSRERFLNAKNTLAQLLRWGTIPIVNENDTVVVKELKFGDNDALASFVLNLVDADLFINLTSTDGVLSENPLSAKESHTIPCIENIETLDINHLCGGKTSVGTGGMYSKLLSARRAAQLGVATLILPGKKPDIIKKAFNHENIGTWIIPNQQHISRKKYWLAYQSEPQGTIFIDEGACQALQENGKSLLPVGVHSVIGNFCIGSLVQIFHDKKAIGVGLSNYCATDLRKIMGRKRTEVAEILGNAHYPEVIHRDNLLLNAVITYS